MRYSLLGGLIGLAAFSAAEPVKFCPSEVQGLCYSFAVPSGGSSNDLYFQLQASTDYQWVAMGQGTQMAGSNMFIMYANAKGDNVTISPRLGLGEFEPDFNSNAKVTLLAGSGIKDGMMTANVKCSGGSCTSWRGGSMRLTDTSSNWIYSHKAGSSLKSNSQSAQLEQHDAHGNFKIDLTKAQSSSSTNPFVASSGSGSGNGSGNNSGGNSGNNGGSTTGGNTSTGGATAGSSVSIDREMLRMRQIAHGVMMSLAFLIFLPTGALTMRLFPGPRTIWIHAGLQWLSYFMVLSGMGIGIWMALTLGLLKAYHAIIGLVVSCTLILQPPTGILQHKHYKVHQSRSIFAHVHIWLGRSLILLGAINGGFGLQLANNSTPGLIAYSVIAGLVFLAYIGAVLVTGSRKRRAGGVQNGVSKRNGHHANGHGSGVHG